MDGQYKIIDIIGTGANGLVFAAVDKNNNMYAIKLSRDHTQLIKESQILDEIHTPFVYPNIVRSYGTENPEYCIVDFKHSKELYTQLPGVHIMEYCQSYTLLKLFNIGKGMPIEIIQFWVKQLACAIEYIHAKGYAHMDLKLNNISLDAYYNIKLVDFGSAIKVPASKLIDKSIGTPNYMSPELKIKPI
jgi:serine/threonine protein kinase